MTMLFWCRTNATCRLPSISVRVCVWLCGATIEWRTLPKTLPFLGDWSSTRCLRPKTLPFLGD